MKKLNTYLIASISLIVILTGCSKEEFNYAPNDEVEVTYAKKTSDTEPIVYEEDVMEDTNVKFAQEGVADDCKKVSVCSGKGKKKSISINAVFTHLSNGEVMFSCDGDIGLGYQEVMNAIIPRIIEKGGDIGDANTQKIEFESWFYDTYCNPVEDDDADTDKEEEEGGVFDDDAGSDL